ncbi:MAG: hypothetical protein R3F14_30290 [Polyangiaceae bacterium]
MASSSRVPNLRRVRRISLSLLALAPLTSACGSSTLCDHSDPAGVSATGALRAGDEEGSAVAALTDVRWEAPYRGALGESRLHIACKPGWLAVGLHGRADDEIDRLGLVCRFLAKGGGLEDEDIVPAAGGEGGRSFLTTCPPGMAIAGLAGRAGDRLDRIQLICDTLPGATLYYANPVGGVGGSPFLDVAPNRHFLTGIIGRTDLHVRGIWALYHKLAP